MDPESITVRKRAVRKDLAQRRGLLSADERDRLTAELAEVVFGLPEVRAARTVAAYVGVGAEPGTGALLDQLRGVPLRVLLPITHPDMTLDWAEYGGTSALVDARYGLREPVGARLGIEAVRAADVVLVPALAVDPTGVRLGRGGGCYDRVLAMLPPTTLTCALLYPDELLDEVPAEPHDARVAMAASAAGAVRFGG